MVFMHFSASANTGKSILKRGEIFPQPHKSRTEITSCDKDVKQGTSS